MARWLALLLCVLMAALPASADKRAFIVGVGDYDLAANASGIEDLSKTVSDATAYADRFEALGWAVDRKRFVLLDPTLAQFDAALDDFVSEIRPGDEVAFIYSGHGWSFGRENFITFTNTVFDPNGTATNETSFGLGSQVLPRLGLRSRIAQQRPHIVVAIIDACREAPFGEGSPQGLMNLGGGGTMGVRPTKGPRGSMVIYSAGEGEFASETLGPGDDHPNSAFSRFMLDALTEADRPLKDMFDDVRRDVFYEAKKFSRTQTPAIYDEFVEDYCLSGACREGDEEASDLQGVNDCESARAFNAKWPNGRLSAPGKRLEASYCAVLETRPAPTASTSAGVDELDLLQEVGKPSGSKPPPSPPPGGWPVPDEYGEENTVRDCDVCPEMVVIPAGSFVMGSPIADIDHVSERPQRTVQIDYQFAVGKFEVTWDEWEACLAGGGCDGYLPKDLGWGRGSRPVISVSWNDAQAYVAWLSRKTNQNYRLLTEAEWEYAARAGTTGTYSWGSEDPTCVRGARNGANFRSCPSDRTEPVGFSAPNDFGLHDMHGNVWEWVQDCYVNDYSGAPIDGSAREEGDCTMRVVRGGSFSKGPNGMEASQRGREGPMSRSGTKGFRVARSF